MSGEPGDYSLTRADRFVPYYPYEIWLQEKRSDDGRLAWAFGVAHRLRRSLTRQYAKKRGVSVEDAPRCNQSRGSWLVDHVGCGGIRQLWLRTSWMATSGWWPWLRAVGEVAADAAVALQGLKGCASSR
jgi:hypothetical protein